MGKKSALSRTIIIKFSLTRNKALAVMVGGLLCVMAVDLGCETLTLTTYYPAPYGVYSKMRVTEYIQSGKPGHTIRVGDISGLAWAPGAGGKLPDPSHGIYAETGSVNDVTIGASNDANLMPDRDLMLYPGRNLVLGPGVYFKDMCKWVTYITGNNNRTYCNGTAAASQGWSVFMSGDSSNQSATAFVRDAAWDDEKPATQITHAAFVMSQDVGSTMLCCKLEEY